jgi:hypothetical protein
MTTANTNDGKYVKASSHPEVRRRLERRSILRDGGCIDWGGSRSERGYGTMTIDKTAVYAHRLSYWVRVGPIPSGQVIDHMCHNPACINTEHMVLTDMVSNSKRSLTALLRKCPQGHEYSESNTRIWKDKKGRSHRYCITCTNRRNAARRKTTR